MHTIEAMMPMTQVIRLREPMTRVPVFKEAHPPKLASFSSFGMVNKSETKSAK